MLTSRLLRHPRCQLLSKHASTPCPRPSVRAFHASAPRRAAIDAWLLIPHEMLQFIHIGLPWYAALPASAFILRGFLTLALGRRVRASTARYIGLSPLRQAIAFQVRDKMMKEGQFKSPREAKLTISRAVRLRTADLDKRWDCSLGGQLGWTFLQLPIFMTMADLIRHMCDTKDGLLGMTLSGLGMGEDRVMPHSVGAESTLPGWWYEASFANEGMLWFPDLLVPDPIGALPYIVSALMFTNVYLTKNSPDAVGKMSKTSGGIRKLLLVVALSIGPLCQEVPAALLLYWASSTASVMLWNQWLDKKYPAARGFGACARPLMLMAPPKKFPTSTRPAIQTSAPRTRRI